MAYRIETDSLGEMSVPVERLWGATTQRALENFTIGTELMPMPLIYAYALVKKASATVNEKFLGPSMVKAICRACDDVLSGKLDSEFPLGVWQTGSGTQTNMNVNEVLAHRANVYLTQGTAHPHDHINFGMSTNDSFPTAMHIAVALETHQRLLPALSRMEEVLAQKVEAFRDIIKIGRTHLQDATPLTLGQEFSGYQAQIAYARKRVISSLEGVYALAQGGSAVGTGLNTSKGYAQAFAREIARLTGLPFVSASNKFEALATHDALVEVSGQLNTLAVSLSKIAGDIKLLGSGPRCGLGEILLPAEDVGSSIMPSKVNPTQAEAMAMVAAQVMGNHVTITVAGAGGQLELNVYKPVIAYNILQSLRLLSDVMLTFTRHCLEGLMPEEEAIKTHLERSLMLVAALNPHVGYDKGAEIAKKARREGITLKEAAVGLGYVTPQDFDKWVNPRNMVEPS